MKIIATGLISLPSDNLIPIEDFDVGPAEDNKLDFLNII